MRQIRYALLVFFTVATVAGCGDDDDRRRRVATGSAVACERSVADALHECLGDLGSAFAGCFAATGVICDDDAATVRAAMASAEGTIAADCSDAFVQEAGYGPAMTEASVIGRAQEMCRAEASALAIRSFGGPHGASWAGADEGERACLTNAHARATSATQQVFLARGDCLAAEDGGGCDLAATDATIAAIEIATREAVATECSAIQALVGIDADTFAQRAVAQAACLTAAAHPTTTPFDLNCGPQAAPAPLPRGSYSQVVLDEERWGTRCGNGSPYAFQVRLAPEGFPVDNVLVAMQGGGVCIFEQDCIRIPDSLFESLNDTAPRGGIMSNDPEVSPFANWTKVFLPYCTQDVFIGGGVTSEFNTISVERYGAVNVRAALRYVRNVLWDELDSTTEEGYRPDRVRAFVGGFSAGAFGTLYNYHWVLDDLQWARTTAFPDAGLALDNGTPLGVATLGNLLLAGPPQGWGARPSTPPYCFRGPCAVGPNVLAAAAPRLGRVPEQQFMILSNQLDDTQVDTTFFEEDSDWVNTLRRSYCDTKDFPGINYFMPAEPRSIHVISLDDDRFMSLEVDGQTMRDWFAGAIEDPTGVVSRVVEGTLADAIDGVAPFPCDVAP